MFYIDTDERIWWKRPYHEGSQVVGRICEGFFSEDRVIEFDEPEFIIELLVE